MTEQEIHNICKRYEIENYTINSDGSIDVRGNVYLSYNKLTSLENCPNEISGSVYLTGNNLKNLKGFGKVGGLIYLNGNPLESFEGYNGDINKVFCLNKKKLIRKTKLKILDTL